MKEIKLPTERIQDKKTGALELLEDIVMVRGFWRVADGPKLAGIVFAALDSCTHGVLRLPDAAYEALRSQVALDPTMTLQPREANRLFLRVARAIYDAEEIQEEG